MPAISEQIHNITYRAKDAWHQFRNQEPSRNVFQRLLRQTQVEAGQMQAEYQFTASSKADSLFQLFLQTEIAQRNTEGKEWTSQWPVHITRYKDQEVSEILYRTRITKPEADQIQSVVSEFVHLKEIYPDLPPNAIELIIPRMRYKELANFYPTTANQVQKAWRKNRSDVARLATAGLLFTGAMYGAYKVGPDLSNKADALAANAKTQPSPDRLLLTQIPRTSLIRIAQDLIDKPFGARDITVRMLLQEKGYIIDGIQPLQTPTLMQVNKSTPLFEHPVPDDLIFGPVGYLYPGTLIPIIAEVHIVHQPTDTRYTFGLTANPHIESIYPDTDLSTPNIYRPTTTGAVQVNPRYLSLAR